MSEGAAVVHTEQEQEHEEPAVEDWPKGVGETSVWPVIAAVGAATLYVGAAATTLSFGNDAIFPRWPGLVTFLGGFSVFLVGIFGWLYHGFVYHYWMHGTDAHDRLTLRTAMVLFLGTEIATFGGGFGYYFYIRAQPWPPAEIPELLSWVVFVNTALLIASSFTMHFAHHALRNDDHSRFVRLTGATVVLGALFLCGQVYEYYDFVVEKGFTLTSGIFATAFFPLTGLHGLHVTLGVVVLSIVLVRGWRLNQYSAERSTSVSTATIYWHFIDAVWLVLVASLYIGGSIDMP